VKKILLALTIIGILTAGLTALDNGLTEWRNRNVEIAVDITDVQALAREAEVTTAVMLARLRDLGATAVGLREVTVTRYRQEGRLTVIQGGELLNDWRLTGSAPPSLEPLLTRGQIQPESVYLLTDDRELAVRLTEKARVKLRKQIFSDLSTAPYIVGIPEDYNRLLNFRLGLDPLYVSMAVDLGLRIVPRPDNMYLNSEEAVRATLSEFLSLPEKNLSAVVFDGTEATGFPKYLETTASVLNEADMPFGTIEIFTQQLGVPRLAALTDSRTVIVHANGPTENVNSIVNSVRERRARLVYLRFTLTDSTLLESGPALLSGVSESLAAYGYRSGPVSFTPSRAQPFILLLVVLLGVASAATLLLLEIVRREHPWFWPVLAFSFLGLLAALAVLPVELFRQLAAIMAAVIFVSLAVVTQQLNRVPPSPRGNRSALGWALLTLLRTFLVTCAGGLVVYGLTSIPFFYSGAAVFRGVKLVHTLPLAVISLVAVLRIYYYDRRQETLRDMVKLGQRFFTQPVLIAYLFLSLVFVALAYVYVGRTGHTAGVPVPASELRLRQLLGDFLVVRPRLKEFLFGYPLAILGLTMLARGARDSLTTILVILGAIAPVSLINTFMHFTASLAIILLRSFNGLWLGTLLGILLCLAVALAVPLVQRGLKL
jgi:hypothetical protein